MATNQWKNWKKYNAQRKATGYLSGLEHKVGTHLKTKKVPHEYETLKLSYVVPARKTYYKPDFILTKQATIIEVKGEFDSGDRKKMKLVKATYPDLRIVLLFNNPQAKIGTKSKTTYAKWCEDNGFPYAKATAACPLPPEWLTYKPTAKERKALKEVMA